jgi:hypothetical protein
MNERCEAIVTDDGEFSKRCPNDATVTTEYDSHYCEEHKDWDE